MTQNSWNATVPVIVGKGGSAAATLTGVITGNGTSAFTVSTVTDNTVIRGSTSNLVQNSTITVTDAGEMVNASQPAFNAYLATSDLNVTGDNTNYTIGGSTSWTEVFDQNADFNTNGTFTAPVTGKYFFSGWVGMVNSSMGSATLSKLTFVTSNQVYQNLSQNSLSEEPNSQIVLSVFTDMDASDTVILRIRVNGVGGKTADIEGSSSPTTVFSGALLC